MPRHRNLPIVEFGWYYFARSAANNRKIITTELERDTFRNLLAATLPVHGAHLHFVHVDGNEMHLGIRAGSGSLTKALGSFCEKFAHEINRSRNESGSLFRPHARVVLIQPGRSFLLLGRFIHWIPRLVVNGSVMDSGTQLSSDANYRSRTRMRGLDTSLVLRIVSHGSRNPGVQDEAYRALFDQPPSAAEIELFRKGSPQDPRIVGDPQFIARTARELGVTLHSRARRQPGAIEEIPPGIARMLERFSALWHQQLPPHVAQRWTRVSTLENVCSKSRQPPLPMLRALATAHFVDSGRFRLDQLEAVFQCRPRTLSAGRRRTYQSKFEALFGRPYDAVLSETTNDLAFAAEGHEEREQEKEGGKAETEPIVVVVGSPPCAAAAASVEKVHVLSTPRSSLYR
jgi:hypothetical protein